MKIAMLVVMFFLIAAFFIISQNNLHLNNEAEFSKLGSMYFSWFSGVFDNLKSLSSYVVKMDWLPD